MKKLFGKIGKRFEKRAQRVRRGFASTLIAVLAIVLVSGIAAFLVVSSFQQRAVLSSFESRKAANAFENAAGFLNSSFRDALFDYEYARTGCPPNNPPVFSDAARTYLNYAVAELNSTVETNASNFVFGRAEHVAGALPGYDYYVDANVSLSLFVRFGSAFKNESLFFERRIDVNNTGMPSSPWLGNESGLQVIVTCS